MMFFEEADDKSQGQALINTFGASCVGAGHKKTNKVMQDYSTRETFGESGENTILIVSDGHGSDPYFRSDVGSRIAVDVTKEKLKAFVSEFKYGEDWPHFVARGIREDANGYSQSDTTEADRYGENIFRQLFYQILSCWREEVHSHWTNNPPTDEELLRASPNGDDRVKNIYRKANPPILEAYGCTLIAAVHTPDYWFAFQLGDGSCVSFDDEGNWHCPIPWDSRCDDNITTSLCDFGIESFRYCYGTSAPKVLFIASDGIDDSFLGIENGLIRNSLGAWYRALICEIIKKKFIWKEDEVVECLSELSAAKSKDDMSLQMWITNDCGTTYCNKLYQISLAEEEDNLNKRKEELSDLKEKVNGLKEVLNGLMSTSQNETDTIEKSEKEVQWIERFVSRLTILVNKFNCTIKKLTEKKDRASNLRDTKISELHEVKKNVEEQKKISKKTAGEIAIKKTMMNSYLRDIEMKENEISSIEKVINLLKDALK